MEYLAVGRVVKTIGLKGEVKIYPSTHFRDSRFKSGNHLLILDDSNNVLRTLTIKTHRKNGDCDNLIFQEIPTIELAEEILNKEICVEKDSKFLKKDQYFYSDLINMDVYFDNQKYIGKVSKVEDYCSYQTLRVKTEGKDVLIPFVKAFIKSVDLEKNHIEVHYIDGLM